MIAAFKSDLVWMRGMLGQTLVLLVFFGFVCTVFSDSAVLLVPLATAALPFSAMSNLFAVDEQNGWQAFKLALPISRDQAVAGRALTGLVTTVGALALGLLAYACARLFASQAFGTAGEEVVVVLTMGAAACAVTLLMLGTLLVVNARFGFTKAVRYLPFALVLVAFVGSYAVSALSKGGMEGWIASLNAWFAAMVASPGVLAASVAAALLGCLVVYGLLCLAAARVYRAREF